MHTRKNFSFTKICVVKMLRHIYSVERRNKLCISIMSLLAVCVAFTLCLVHVQMTATCRFVFKISSRFRILVMVKTQLYACLDNVEYKIRVWEKSSLITNCVFHKLLRSWRLIWNLKGTLIWKYLYVYYTVSLILQIVDIKQRVCSMTSNGILTLYPENILWSSFTLSLKIC